MRKPLSGVAVELSRAEADQFIRLLAAGYGGRYTPGGCHPGPSIPARRASQRCRVRARYCARARLRPPWQTAPAGVRRTAWRPRSTRTRMSPARWSDENGDIEPLEAMMAGGRRALANRRPDTPQHRLQPDPVLIGGEHLDRPLRMARGLLGHGRGELFLKA